MVKATLVLEGGANRGVFTSGVLDYLMEKDMSAYRQVRVMRLIMCRNRLGGAGNV